jgi:phosphopantothenate--cysteine ligase
MAALPSSVPPRVFIVTAGGMRQPIDSVRSLSNTSRGALGVSMVKEIFSQERVAVDRVYYVHGPDALVPEEHQQIVRIPVRGVLELLETMQTLLREHPRSYVIHAMAVADYMPAGVYPPEAVRTLLDGGVDESVASKKISSDSPELYLRLQRAPKVIDAIKQTAPHCFLVGFKLLVEASDDELQTAAFKTLRRSRANLVLANDLAQIQSGQPHRGLLVYPEAHRDIIEGGKPALARRVVDVMLRRGETRYGRSVAIDTSPTTDAIEALPLLQECVAQLSADALPVVDSGTYGNLSLRGEHGGFVITGRGVDKRALTLESVATVAATSVDEDPVYSVGEYRGPCTPSIDSAIHAAVYAQTTAQALLHVHDFAVYEGLPLTRYNYACGTEAEARAISELAPEATESFALGLHKHGVLVGGASLEECVTILSTLERGLSLTPLARWSGDSVQWLLGEWDEHLEEVRDPAGTSPELERLLDQRGFWLVLHRGSPVGVVVYLPELRDDRGWTGRFFMYLSPEQARGQGLGARVVAMVEGLAQRDDCDCLELITRPGCAVAEYYQHKLGFTPIESNDSSIRLQRELQSLEDSR